MDSLSFQSLKMRHPILQKNTSSRPSELTSFIKAVISLWQSITASCCALLRLKLLYISPIPSLPLQKPGMFFLIYRNYVRTIFRSIDSRAITSTPSCPWLIRQENPFSATMFCECIKSDSNPLFNLQKRRFHECRCFCIQTKE